MHYLNPIKEHISKKLALIFNELVLSSNIEENFLYAQIETPPETSMGDYSLPCFNISKQLKKSPNDLASEIATKFNSTDLIVKTESSGGYVNFFLNPSSSAKLILPTILKQKEDYGRSNIGNDKVVVIDFSSPNIAKPLSIAHLRSTVIGNAIYKILSFIGYKCIGVNHLGDWGTSFGQLICAFLKWGNYENLNSEGVSYLKDLYVKFVEEEKINPSLHAEAKEWFRKLESGNELAIKLWQMFKDISIKEFQKVYNLLDVRFDTFTGESFYNGLLEETINELKAKGLLKESQGAQIVEIPESDVPPCIIRKSDDSSLYATREISSAVYRIRNFNAQILLYVVGQDQKLHFEQVFKVLELMGYEWAKNCYHIDFGLITFKGEKLSTRRGRIIYLMDVIEEAIERVKQIMKDRQLKYSDSQEVANKIAIGAVIFADLKNKRIKNVEFDWNKVLSFEGDSGPYVQYTYVRIISVLRKFEQCNYEKSFTPDFSLLIMPEEKELVKKIIEFPEYIVNAARFFEPSILADFLLSLTASFNNYYHIHRIISEDKNLTLSRIALCDALKYVISNSMNLLGVPCVEEM